MEAGARMSDPVHGLAGIAETISQKLDNLTSQLAFANQQNQFHHRHSGAMQQEPQQFQPNGAKGASSSPLGAVPSPSQNQIWIHPLQ